MPARHLVRRLAEEIRSVERAARGREEEPHFTTGTPLDSLLPGGGLCRGTLVEWLPATDEDGSGVTLWALLTARAACWGDLGFGIGDLGLDATPHSAFPGALWVPHSAAPLVVVDCHGTFYPPAAAAWGVPLSSMILVRPANVRDEAWALDQALRSSAVGAVLAWPHRLDGRAFRRLQLAAESSGTIGVLVRPASAKREPTWADFRFQISDFRLDAAADQIPNPNSQLPKGGWRFSLQRLHARGSGPTPDAIQIEITPEGSVQEIRPAERALAGTPPYGRPKSAI